MINSFTKQPRSSLFFCFEERILQVILSIYLFNEQRGFRYLEKLALVFAQKYPDESQMLFSIQKHARDERYHYGLFCAYFESRGLMPFDTNEWCGYIDQIVKLNFGKNIEQLEPFRLLDCDQDFFRLCRLIMVTEMRGMKQVELVLKNWPFAGRPDLVDIFRVIARDEPSHCYPYQAWLRRHGQATITWKEAASDIFVNYSLMLWKIPVLVLWPMLNRRREFPYPSKQA